MPNFTITPPFFTNPNTFSGATVTLRQLFNITPPFFTNPNTFRGATVILRPLFFITPPFFQNPNTFFGARLFQVTEPDQILKNEVRRVT
jgi:hypothetical protein